MHVTNKFCLIHDIIFTMKPQYFQDLLFKRLQYITKSSVGIGSSYAKAMKLSISSSSGDVFEFLTSIM